MPPSFERSLHNRSQSAVIERYQAPALMPAIPPDSSQHERAMDEESIRLFDLQVNAIMDKLKIDTRFAAVDKWLATIDLDVDRAQDRQDQDRFTALFAEIEKRFQAPYAEMFRTWLSQELTQPKSWASRAFAAWAKQQAIYEASRQALDVVSTGDVFKKLDDLRVNSVVVRRLQTLVDTLRAGAKSPEVPLEEAFRHFLIAKIKAAVANPNWWHRLVGITEKQAFESLLGQLFTPEWLKRREDQGELNMTNETSSTLARMDESLRFCFFWLEDNG